MPIILRRIAVTSTKEGSEYLLDFIITNTLVILNKENDPTFVTQPRREIMDISVASARMSCQVTQWRVSDVPSIFDHRYLCMAVRNVGNPTTEYS